jgi:predicted CoA-binding protein
MASNYESFFTLGRFGVVGHTTAKLFPILSFRRLKAMGKTVYPIDPGTMLVDGDPAYPTLACSPQSVEGLVIELPKAESAGWLAAAADAGIGHVWIHMAQETPEAVALAAQKGINLRTGSCAVMDLNPGMSYHGIHKLVMKLTGKY